jgi:uncharacterized protein
MNPPDKTTRAIYRASMDGDAQTLLSLIGANISRLHTNTPFGTPLHIAASRGDLALARILVELGADINRRGGTFDGAPINSAASNGHLSVIQYLIEQKADLDTSTPERNPLFGAILNGSLETVELLLSAGMDASIQYSGESMKNMGAIEFAIERGQKEIVDFLQVHVAIAQPINPADA